MAIPQPYSQQGAGAVASFTFTELIEGTGIIQLFGNSTNAAGTASYNLSISEPFSNLVSSSGALSLGGTFEVDFDTPELNLPRNVRGTAYIQVPWRVTTSASSDNVFVFAKLRKWDGTAETEIAETSGAIVSSAAGTQNISLLKISDIPITHFKQGEQIRMTVGLNGVTSTNNPKGHIAHDPQNRTNDWFTSVTNLTTILKVFIPFKTDL